MDHSLAKVWIPDLIYDGSGFHTGVLISDNKGHLGSKKPEGDQSNTVSLKNRLLLPGLVNAHSHAFQRVIRGRTEYRTRGQGDSFWTWREMMYSAANRLSPEDLYDASRMAFLEMALNGITTVGEFHYLHHMPDGTPYDDPNLLAKQVIKAALDVGLRIVLLRVAYARAGFRQEPNREQARFIEADAELYMQRTSLLVKELAGNDRAKVGVAPHSVRAVPLEYIKAVTRFALAEHLVVHMHVAEQPAEVVSCQEEHGLSPVALLQAQGLLGEHFTAVHAIHVTDAEVSQLAAAMANVCACPATERNLGDGVVPAAAFFSAGVPICLGSDSQTQIDVLEDARELEYHLRLQKMERAILAPRASGRAGLAERLFDCATVHGARSLGYNGDKLAPETPADFFTIDLNDPSIAGATEDDLLPAVVFSMSRAAVKDVVVGGKQIVSDGVHHDQADIVSRFENLQRRLWS